MTEEELKRLVRAAENKAFREGLTCYCGAPSLTADTVDAMANARYPVVRPVVNYEGRKYWIDGDVVRSRRDVGYEVEWCKVGYLKTQVALFAALSQLLVEPQP